MGIYNVHAGHCPQWQGANGAVGLLYESVEDRLVKNRVIDVLRNAGHTVYDCTDDTNCDVSTNLARIVAKCNAHAVDLDVSIHLNSGRNDYKGDSSTGGVEVWCYDSGTAAIAQRICDNIANELGIRNRGVKYSKDLYVLNSTNSQALLVECCFVDDKDDADKWDANVCGDAIASGILGKKVTVPTEKTTVPATPKQIPGNPVNNAGIYYQAHCETVGWLGEVHDGQTAGTTNYAKRMEALKIDTSKIKGLKLKVRAHIQGEGWVDYGYITKDTVIGTTGLSKRLEALEIIPEGLPAGKKLYINLHVQKLGWTGWTSSTQIGTVGMALRAEAIQMKIA